MRIGKEETMKDVNFFTAQLKLWARIFDYKGKSTRKEYWFPFILHAILGLLVFCDLAISILFTFLMIGNDGVFVAAVHYIFLILALPLMFYLTLSVIPWISLTVRRLRDAGKSGWWTLLLLFFGIGHIILFIFCAAGSAIVGLFAPELNSPGCIYGPPEMLDPTYNQNEGVYGPPDWFDPDNNVPEPMYGPPQGDIDDPDYDPDVNTNGDVYGPPQWDEDDEDAHLGPDVNENYQIYGPPDWLENDIYNSDDNVNEDVYGPPEWFE